MLRSLALAGALVLAYFFAPPMREVSGFALDTFEAYRPPYTRVIGFSPGGGVIEFVEDFTRARQRGDSYKIDGLCISACTMITGEFPAGRVCVTPFAKLGFHAAFTQPFGGERKFSPDGTSLIWTVYPERVREILRKHGWSGPETDQPTLIWIEGAELLSIFKACDS